MSPGLRSIREIKWGGCRGKKKTFVGDIQWCAQKKPRLERGRLVRHSCKSGNHEVTSTQLQKP